MPQRVRRADARPSAITGDTVCRGDQPGYCRGPDAGATWRTQKNGDGIVEAYGYSATVDWKKYSYSWHLGN
jgi:hypothetical protein